MTELSPAAQAVLKAACIHHGLFNEEIVQRRRMVAAVLRAAADQLGDEMIVVGEGFKGLTRDDWQIVHVEDLLAIADELDVQ